jgi:hypothetical protein
VSEWIGGYRIVRQLGEGGMGRLLLAEAAGVGGFARQVVLKVVKDELDPVLKQALLDEARLQATLVHRNVVPVLDLKEDLDGQRLVVLEHVDGIDVRFLLKRKQRIPWQLGAFIALEVAAGLDYAHRKADGAGRPLGIVHRDVSPANILCSFEGEVKLTDFGVAKLGKDSAIGEVKGKLAYMPPEQARGEAVDARADVYSLGVVLYEMVMGDNPFSNRRRPENTATLESATYEGLAETLPLIPPEIAPRLLAEAVARATTIDIDARFTTAAAFREALIHIPGQSADPAVRLTAFLAPLRQKRNLQTEELYQQVLGGGHAVTRRGRAALARGPAVRPLPERATAPKDAAQILEEAPAPSSSRARLALAGLAGTVAAVLLVWVSMRQAIPPTAPPPPAAKVTTPGRLAPAVQPRDDHPPEMPNGDVSPETPHGDHSAETPQAAVTPGPAHKRSEPRRRGSLSINAIPWANIILDGRPAGHTPRLEIPVDAGRHVVKLITRAGDARTRAVEVPSGRAVKVSVVFSNDP